MTTTEQPDAPHTVFIRLLGGCDKVSEWLRGNTDHEVGSRAIYKWGKEIPIPLIYRADLAQLASQRGVPLPEEFFPKMAAQ